MSLVERSASLEATAAEERPHSDRLRVIMAGRVGDMQARLATSGFDVVAVAETEDALIDAMSADEADAIVVEADLCASLEHVRDLAPDALLIAVGDHTPAGALGRIERGVSGTVMAGLLHALVAEGVGAAAVWGLVPAFQPGAGQHVLQHMGGSLLWAKADLVRFLVNVVNACRDHAELVTASAVAVTVSAGVLLTLSGPRTEERPARVLVPAPAVERVPQEPAQQHPVVAVSPTTPTSTHGPSGTENEPGDRRGQNRGDSEDLVRNDGPGETEHEQVKDSDDQVVEEGSEDQVVEERNGPHGKNEDPHGKNEDPHGVNQDNDDQGENESEGDQAENSDDQGENEDEQGENEDDQGEDEGNDYQGEDTDPTAPL